MYRRIVRIASLGVLCFAGTGCTLAFIARANVATDGTQANQSSFFGGAISGDGRFVAFESLASTLVPNDTNGARDVFVHDNMTGVTERVSVASDESEGDEPATGSAGGALGISPDGRYVVFHASFSDLVPDDTNGSSDVFLRDRELGTTERVSLAEDESEADRGSFSGDVSADGRYVTFTSSATNLVDGDTNGDPPCPFEDPTCELTGRDIFVRDRLAGTTERVSVADDESQAESSGGSSALNSDPGISDDGRYVVFTSLAAGLVAADPSDNDDIFVRDRLTDSTELVSVGTAGGSANGISFASDLSADGRFVAFMSTADDLVAAPSDPFLSRQVFLRDRVAATTERVSESTNGTLGNRQPDPESAVSADGRYVVFASFADDLVPDDTNGATDIFMRDRLLGTLERVSLTQYGEEPADESPPAAGAFSTHPELSDDARYVVFSSQADNLVFDDTNGLVTDVFTRFVLAPQVESVTPPNLAAGTTTVTVTGQRFLEGVSASVSGTGAAVLHVALIDETTVEVEISVAVDATPGVRLLSMKNSGSGPGATRGGSDTCACISVTGT